MCAIFARQQTTQRASNGFLEAASCPAEKVIDNLPLQIHFIIEMIWSTGLAPREFDYFCLQKALYLPPHTSSTLAAAVRASPSKTIPRCVSVRTECWTSRLLIPCPDCTDEELLARGGIRKEAWLFCRTSSSVRLCWELEEPKGPQGPTLGPHSENRRFSAVYS